MKIFDFEENICTVCNEIGAEVEDGEVIGFHVIGKMLSLMP